MGPDGPGIWDCESTASGCDGDNTPLPPGWEGMPQGEATSRAGTEDTESRNTDPYDLGQAPKVGAWPLHVRPGLHRL